MNEHRGLCLSCRNAPTCTFLRNPDEAVLECDEFDGFESVIRSPKSIPPRSMMDFTSNPGKKDFNGAKGLCSLCEDRKTCTYPKPEGGVWHCEEYR
jgi:hypothetical protein